MSLHKPERRRVKQIDDHMDLHRIQDGSYYIDCLGSWIELGNTPQEARRRAQAIIESIHEFDGYVINAEAVS